MLSPHGVRSVSKRHAANPFVLELDGQRFVLDYEPAESTTPLFGGNSNWRGPVWFPLNFLLIEALQKHHYFLGDDFKVECPTGSGNEATLWDVTTDLTHRLISLFLRDADGRRPVNGDREKFDRDPHWRDLVLFHEYFHGDTGAGLGASHQTGWTGVVAKLIQQYAEYALSEQAADPDRRGRDRRTDAPVVTIALPLDAEWLESDAMGGFASGTLAGYRTRRYHALLLTSRRPPTDRVVLVNGIEAWVDAAGSSFPLSTQHYAPDVIQPRGIDHLADFTPEPWPTLDVRAAGRARHPPGMLVDRVERRRAPHVAAPARRARRAAPRAPAVVRARLSCADARERRFRFCSARQWRQRHLATVRGACRRSLR